MQAKLEQCRDILKTIPAEDAIRIEAMRVFQEVLTELKRIRLGIDRLSLRELQVFELIGGGFSLKEIAPLLQLSLKTIETYRDNIREKLNIENANKVHYVAFHWMAAKAEQVSSSASVCGPSQSVAQCTPKVSLAETPPIPKVTGGL
jgi:DNA-binding NarL/FixJ family response regulator